MKLRGEGGREAYPRPSSSLIVHMETCGMLHAGKNKEGVGIHCLRICWIS